MVERAIEPEVKKVFEAIKNGQNFILEGGAGSGKTYSLISIIEKISNDEPNKSIVCITYTNNAVAEIKSRISNDKLWVSTIHEFIWRIIGKFQKEIKECLVELINDTEQRDFKKPRDILDNQSINQGYFDHIHIEYDERYSMKPDDNNKVQISHDHILIIAEKMFSKYTKLSDILIDTANYIFVDEYQDTNPLVINILLNHIQNSPKKNIIGFFGDAMQAIYNSGVENIDSYGLEKVLKEQNRRNPAKIIDLANKFRNDGLIQVPSGDANAPNMDKGTPIQGTVKFIYGENLEQLQHLRNSSTYKKLGFDNPSITKELRLTHKLNSEMAGFLGLFELYNSDLFVKLIAELRKKIDAGSLDATGKTFEQLAEEAQIKVNRNSPLLVDEIKSNPVYSDFYNEIKASPFEEIIDKIRINKDSLLSYKFNGLINRYEAGTYRDRILKKLDLIYELLELYNSGKVNHFLRLTKFKIVSLNDKVLLANIMNRITDSSNTIETVLNIALQNRLILQDDLFDNYIEHSGYYLWSRIKNLPFQEYMNCMAYLREYVSVITQHKVKGSEYDNVLVLLDNGKWTLYDFKTLFGQGSKNTDVQNRTKKLFYVTVTRAMKNLIIYMPSNDRKIIEKARDYFNIEDISNVLNIQWCRWVNI